jgi:hypothetical protein
MPLVGFESTISAGKQPQTYALYCAATGIGYLVPLRPKHSPQHPILKQPKPPFLSLNVSEQVLHPYKTTGKIIALYILIFKFLCSRLEDKRFRTEWQQTFPDSSPHTGTTSKINPFIPHSVTNTTTSIYYHAKCKACLILPLVINLVFMDPCIVVWLRRNNQLQPCNRIYYFTVH